MNGNSISLWVFNGSLMAFGSYLLYNHWPSTGLTQWLLIIFFAALVFLFSWMKSYISTGETFSFEAVIIITYLLSHGLTGLWVSALGMLGYALVSRQNLRDTMFLVGSSILSLWGGAIFFTGAGGVFGALNLERDFLALLGFFGAYLIFVFGFKSIFRSLVADKPLEVVNLIKDDSFTTGLVIILGVLGSIVYQNSGITGILVIVILQAAIWRILKVFFYSEQKYVKTVETFLNVTENKIPHFRGHSERVTKFCQILLKQMRVSRDERGTIEYAALLHDIGKLGMPEKLLKIRTYLTNDEVHQLQDHSKAGKNLVQQIHGLDKVAELVYCHHEKYDGTGYPRNLSGKEIPLGARIISIANKFDNLIFRDGLRFEQACTEIKNLSGTELDPELTEIFLQALLNYNKVIPVNANQLTDRWESSTTDMVEQLRYYLDKSWVLGTLQMNHVVLWEGQDLKNLSREPVPETIKKYLQEYVKQELPSCRKEFIIEPDSARIFDAYFIPLSKESGLITVFDMTEVLKTEREREERELKIYRDVILAVTQGRLLLTIGDEISNYVHDDSLHTEVRLREAQDVSRARAMVKAVLETVPLTNKRKVQMVLCVSEAATNVIKHVGEGKVGIYLHKEGIRVVISDNGPGIDISQLPQVTLRKGYSTKLSLGYGFTIMLDYLDRLIMCTRGGTTLVLEMSCGTEQLEGQEQLAKDKKVVPENA